MIGEERAACYDRELKIEACRFWGVAQKFPNHFHEYYVIGFVGSGRRLLSCMNREYDIGPGDLLMFNPSDNHACEQADGGTLDYGSLHIAPEVMRQAVLDITGRSWLPQFSPAVACESDLVLLLRELHQAIFEEQKDFKKEETFLFLVGQLLDRYAVPPPEGGDQSDGTGIDNVCRYIDAAYAAHITLDELASLAGMGRYALLRTFTKKRGITPYRYLITVRINAAKRLLENGTPPVDAALLTGFSDQSHFTNFFKEFIGLTPGQYQGIFKDTPRTARSSAEET